MYRVLLRQPEVFPSAKATGIWTNIPAHLKVCPCTDWHQKHSKTIGGSAARRVVLPTMDPFPSKRWTPQELQLHLHFATLTFQEQQESQHLLEDLWQ